MNIFFRNVSFLYLIFGLVALTVVFEVFHCSLQMKLNVLSDICFVGAIHFQHLIQIALRGGGADF